MKLFKNDELNLKDFKMPSILRLFLAFCWFAVFCLAFPGKIPRLQPILVPKDLTEGQKISLSCAADKNTFPLTFDWFKNDKPFKPAADQKIIRPDEEMSILVITSLRGQDSGNYKCVVKNRIGESKSSVDLLVQGKF